MCVAFGHTPKNPLRAALNGAKSSENEPVRMLKR